MSENRIAKESQVKEIVEKINASEALVVAEYAGLTVKEIQELRKQLKEKGVELKVYKNRLVKLAMEEAGFKEINSELTGPNAFAFGMEDGISPAKILAEFAKKHEALKLKTGTYEGKVIDLAELQVIATLPTFEEALTMLAMSMLSPLKNVAVGLNMLVTEGHLEKGAEELSDSGTKPEEEAKPEEAKPEEEAKTETEVKHVVEVKPEAETKPEEEAKTEEESKSESELQEAESLAKDGKSSTEEVLVEKTEEAPTAEAEEVKEGE